MKRLSALLCAALGFAAAAHAAPPDSRDEGSYTVLDIHHEPTAVQMRFFRTGGQWMMDGRKEHENWQPVCRADGRCRLQVSQLHDITRWKARLSPDWRRHTFHCINNLAFAFCRTRHPYRKHQRAYWFFALKNQDIFPLPLKRELVLSPQLQQRAPVAGKP
ncbi:hypothetical protein [Conchiformibius kuhniae]|uniref:Uncharacterized protein n=1 Tax=Conchiformibius kuhniae TaxID=211502 RepID=A0A8T9MXW0_9NEIS|nr:hypothetical protein [Conchiformibius kuhniae]UOP04713.1 hypothetical protein LVJ77_11085 [Conchiformibius kuhniae]